MATLAKKKSKPLSKRKRTVIKSDVTAAFGSYAPSLSKRALYKTNDPEISQDLVQTTFLKTLLYLQRGGKIDMMRSFLNHILNDLIIDEYRKNKVTSLDVLLENGFEPPFNDYEKDINIMDGKGMVLLINSLPKKYQEVMRMRFLQSLSLKEIALLTAQSQNTVAVQVHRGLAKLRALYAAASKDDLE